MFTTKTAGSLCLLALGCVCLEAAAAQSATSHIVGAANAFLFDTGCEAAAGRALFLRRCRAA